MDTLTFLSLCFPVFLCVRVLGAMLSLLAGEEGAVGEAEGCSEGEDRG